MGSQQNELNLHLKVFENTQFPDEFLNTKLINLYCKHMIHTNLNKDSKANRLLAASHKAGYEFCEWGSHEELPSDLLHHLNIITKWKMMITDMLFVLLFVSIVLRETSHLVR